MRHSKRSLICTAAIVLPVLLAACGGRSAEDTASDAPATVVQVPGTDVNRITLTREAARRIDVETAPVRADLGAAHRLVIPYSAVLYSPSGQAWVYVNDNPLTFERHRIAIDHIDGTRAVLSSGPRPGTRVATVGVAELFGTETDVGE
jgi:hypothetical protein